MNKSIYVIQSWTVKNTRKGLTMPYNNYRYFFDEESAQEQFFVQKSRVSLELQCGKNLKGFVVLRVCDGIKGEIGTGTEIKRVEI